MISKKTSIILTFFLICLAIATSGFLFLKKSHTESIILSNNQEENAIQDENQEAKDEADKAINEITVENERKNKIPEKEAKAEPEEKTETPKENKSDLKITNKLISWGYAVSSSRKIDTIVIHSSYDALGDDPYSISGIIAEYKQYGVSAHYLIGRDGKIYRLVDDKNIAYHAGESKVPDGRTGVNAFSIGIELVNTKTGKVTAEQYSSLKELIAEIKVKNKIKYVLGHKDIAPGRKDDPWGFDREKIK